MATDAQVFGPPREKDPKMETLTAAWVETKAAYRAGDLDADAYAKARDKFNAARAKWKREQDEKRGVA